MTKRIQVMHLFGEEQLVYASCLLHGFFIPGSRDSIILYSRYEHLTCSLDAFPPWNLHFLFNLSCQFILASSFLHAAAFPFVDATCSWLCLTGWPFQMSPSNVQLLPTRGFSFIHATCYGLLSVSQSIRNNLQQSTCWFTGSFRD